MAFDLAVINDRVRGDARGFAEECEAEYADKVARVADGIAGNLAKSPIVLLSGPSGSGKTTTAKKIGDALRGHGVLAHTISMDNYFCTVNPKTVPRTPTGEIDYESPECMDLKLLDEHFKLLNRGQPIRIPHFAFSAQARDSARWTPLQLGRDEVVIFEGIHALNDMLAGAHPEAFKLYISARSDIMSGGAVRFKGTWTRLMRRVVRDDKFRGTDPQLTLTMWANVRRGEKMYVSPYKRRADVIFDSSLMYEVPVMRKHAEPLLSRVPDGAERFDELRGILPVIGEFEAADDDVVPPGSILREFIGGGSYTY
jgi:uridine kinase